VMVPASDESLREILPGGAGNPGSDNFPYCQGSSWCTVPDRNERVVTCGLLSGDDVVAISQPTPIQWNIRPCQANGGSGRYLDRVKAVVEVPNTQ